MAHDSLSFGFDIESVSNEPVGKAAMEIVSGSLDGIEIFRGLTPAARQSLASRCAWREYGPKQLIVGHEEASRTVFFLVSGRVRVSVYSAAGKRVTYTDIDSGEMFGEFAAIDGEPRSASVEATHTSLIASMSPELFWEMLHMHPEVSEAVLRRLTRKARSLSRQLYEFSTLNARDRLRLELLRLASGSLNEKDTAVVKGRADARGPRHPNRIAARDSQPRNGGAGDARHHRAGTAHIDDQERLGAPPSGR